MFAICRFIRFGILACAVATGARADPLCDKEYSIGPFNKGPVTQGKFLGRDRDGCPKYEWNTEKQPEEPDTCRPEGSARVELIAQVFNLAQPEPDHKRSAREFPLTDDNATQWGYTAHALGAGHSDVPFEFIEAHYVERTSTRGKRTCLSIQSVSARYNPLKVYVASELDPGARIPIKPGVNKTCYLAVLEHEWRHVVFFDDLDKKVIAQLEEALNSGGLPVGRRPAAMDPAAVGPKKRFYDRAIRDILATPPAAYVSAAAAHRRDVDSPKSYRGVWDQCGGAFPKSY